MSGFHTKRVWLGAAGLALVLAFTAPTALGADAPADKPAAAAKAAASAITAADPKIEPGDLKLLLEPLTKSELETEAAGWFSLLRAKVREVSEAELAVRRKNREIVALDKVKDAAEGVAAASEEAKKKLAAAPPGSEEQKAAAAKLSEANAKLEKSVETTNKEISAPVAGAAPAGSGQPASKTAPGTTAAPAAPVAPVAGDQEIMKRAVESAKQQAEKTGDATVVADKAAAASKEAEASRSVARLESQASATSAAPSAAKAADSSKQADTLAAKVDEATAAKSNLKVQLIDYSTQLGNERTEITDRLKLVLDALDVKGGDSKEIRTYIDAVGGLKLDVTDKTATIARIKAWLVADEGGLRLARNVGLFLAFFLGSFVVARIVRFIMGRMLGATQRGPSQLLSKFIVDMSGRAIVFGGFLAGLSAFEINLSPLLAVIGAAGFVVAFALQGTLSNFASGLLIMLNKPFDVGDDVDVGGGIKGRVGAVSIFSTLIQTKDGFSNIVPNNTIWGGVIINETTGVTSPAPDQEVPRAA